MAAKRPFYVYDNWSAYDELSDNVRLTEALAMRQFDEVCRLRRLGVTIDAYLMDAFWYARDGGYLTWRSDSWPSGPEAWLSACAREGILPGLWFTANTAFHLEPPAAWKDSLGADGWGFSCMSGGFLAGLAGVLEHWYRFGVRVFKFDFADFGAQAAGMPWRDSQVVRTENIAAYRGMLSDFRRRHPGVVLLAYNGFEHTEFMPWTDRPTRPVLDRGWLGVFDTIYCGDPRPADLPLPNFWRTLDVYADAMIHLLHRGSGLSLAEIDNCAFMIGQCGTCYRRGKVDWKTTALLSLARGGRVHLTMGNLEGLTDDDALWLARVQRCFEAADCPSWVGGNPGVGDVYGYATASTVTAVNPSLSAERLVVGPDFEVIYADGAVNFGDGTLELGPGSVALVGRVKEDLGASEQGAMPGDRIAVNWKVKNKVVEGEAIAPSGRDLHLVFRQQDADGFAVRTSGGSPPDGKSSARLLRIEARQGDRLLKVERLDDRIIWSGMSWAYGIIPRSEFVPAEPVLVRFETSEPNASRFEAVAFAGVFIDGSPGA